MADENEDQHEEARGLRAEVSKQAKLRREAEETAEAAQRELATIKQKARDEAVTGHLKALGAPEQWHRFFPADSEPSAENVARFATQEMGWTGAGWREAAERSEHLQQGTIVTGSGSKDPDEETAERLLKETYDVYSSRYRPSKEEEAGMAAHVRIADEMNRREEGRIMAGGGQKLDINKPFGGRLDPPPYAVRVVQP